MDLLIYFGYIMIGLMWVVYMHGILEEKTNCSDTKIGLLLLMNWFLWPILLPVYVFYKTILKQTPPFMSD